MYTLWKHVYFTLKAGWLFVFIGITTRFSSPLALFFLGILHSVNNAVLHPKNDLNTHIHTDTRKYQMIETNKNPLN